MEAKPKMNASTGVGAIFYDECSCIVDETKPVLTFDDPIFSLTAFNWPGTAANALKFTDQHATRGDTLSAFPNVVPRKLGAPLRVLEQLQDPRQRRRFTAVTAPLELRKHCTNDPERPASTNSMVLGAWASADALREWNAWRFMRQPAMFDTLLSRFAVRGYDGRAHIATPDEIAVCADFEDGEYSAPM
jgi:hypothetical protein